MNLATTLGPLSLRTPLVAASGTVGSVVEWVALADERSYGAAIAKSVAKEPWPGRAEPRLAPTEVGMLNSIGIQNPGVEHWAAEVGPQLEGMAIPVWGSAVGHAPEDFAIVAAGLQRAGVAAVEVNLSCPNLEGKGMFALDPAATGAVVAAVGAAVTVPFGAKLSPNAVDIVAVAEAALAAGADWLTLTNTVWGAAIDIERRRPSLSGVIGGYSGVGIKPIALRCVIEVRRALGTVPILGLGGVRKGSDVVEYLMAGASAVGVGTAHFESPKVGRRIMVEFAEWCRRRGVVSPAELVGAGLAELDGVEK